MLPTVLPERSRPTIRCIAAVDLPDPPFSLPSTITRARAGSATSDADPEAGEGAGWEAGLGAESVNGLIGPDSMRSGVPGAIFAASGRKSGICVCTGRLEGGYSIERGRRYDGPGLLLSVSSPTCP